MSRINGVDEKGNPSEASVKNGRLLTRSISTDEIEAAVSNGLGFQSYTAVMSFATAVKQMVFFLENNEDDDIFITSATLGTGVSAGGSDNAILIEQIGNIGVSDPITSATSALTTNRNAGSPKVFDGTINKGPAALGGTEVATNGVLGDFTRSRTFDLTAQLPKGGSIGVAITPPAGNTGMDMTLVVTFHIVNGT